MTLDIHREVYKAQQQKQLNSRHKNIADTDNQLNLLKKHNQ